MNVICIVCKGSADMPTEILNLVANLTAEDVKQFAFICDWCMHTNPEKAAKYVIERTVYKNCNSN